MVKEISIYQVDAFSNQPFRGNPAAVCPLDMWPEDAMLQAIAAENNLSETAFFVKRGGAEGSLEFDLRWFTPVYEVDLCGHATLASAFVVLERLVPAAKRVIFHTRSGPLAVERGAQGAFWMDFPARTPQPAPEDSVALARALDLMPAEVWKAAGVLIGVLNTEAEVRGVSPHMAQLEALEARAVAVTARADSDSDADFVSRFFAPKAGIPEDPVTGSLHCALTPLWGHKLGKTTLSARQISKRGGEVGCAWRADRVMLSGQAVLVLEGKMFVR